MARQLLSIKANPLRGAKHREAARAFVEAFPLETVFTNAQFDKWAGRQGYLTILDPTTEPGSPEWVMHGNYRRRLRAKLNNGGLHPELAENAFKIEKVRGTVDQWRTCSADEVREDLEGYQSVQAAMRRDKEWFQYSAESTRWENKPPEEMLMAEFHAAHIAMMENSILSAITYFQAEVKKRRKMVLEARSRGLDPMRSMKRILHKKMPLFGE